MKNAQEERRLAEEERNKNWRSDLEKQKQKEKDRKQQEEDEEIFDKEYARQEEEARYYNERRIEQLKKDLDEVIKKLI